MHSVLLVIAVAAAPAFKGLSAATVAMIATIGGLVVPPVTSLLKREKWSAPVKQFIAGIVSIAVATAAVYVTTPADFSESLVALSAIVFSASQVIYGLYFQRSTVEAALSSVFSGSTAAPATAPATVAAPPATSATPAP